MLQSRLALGAADGPPRCVQVGIYAKQMTRNAPDIRGGMFPVEFTIIDRLDSPQAIADAAQAAADGTPTAEFKKPNSPYHVKVLLSVRPLPSTAHLCFRSTPLCCTGGYRWPVVATLAVP